MNIFSTFKLEEKKPFFDLGMGFGMSITGQKEQRRSIFEIIRQLPFSERVEIFSFDNHYLGIIEDLEKKIMKANPKVNWDTKNKSYIRQAAIRIFIDDFFEEDLKNTFSKLFDRKASFSNTEKTFMSMFVKMLKFPTFVNKSFGYEKNSFPFLNLLNKGLTDSADEIGRTYEGNPKLILEYALKCLQKEKNINTLKLVDNWVAQWLNPQKMSSLYGDYGFEKLLTQYLETVPSDCNRTFENLLPNIHKMPAHLQEKIWEKVFTRAKMKPEQFVKLSEAVNRFWQTSYSGKNEDIFYRAFIKYLPEELRSTILGTFSSKTLKKYWNSLNPKYKGLIHSKVKTATGKDFLAWHLLQNGDIKSEQFVQIMKKLDLKKHFEFFFHEKKNLDFTVFEQIANELSHSGYYFRRWLLSFKNTYHFPEKLAVIYPNLSDKIRQNRAYAIEMNKHFDLVYHLACQGDTGSLSKLKTLLGKNIFWDSLTAEKDNHSSGLFALCAQGKRGLLKLLSDLPIEEQKLLLTTKNELGRSPLDECTGSFLHIVNETIFNKAYQKEKKFEEKAEKAKPVEKQKASEETLQKNDKALFPRTIIQLPAFENDLDRFKVVNPELYQEVREAMEDLATMSSERIQKELREGWKTGNKLYKTPCVVRDIRGYDYRLGYRVFGDADKNQGKIAFLFFWTHEEYSKKLNTDNTCALVKQAIELAKNDTPPVIPPLPTNTGNGGR